MGKQSTALAGLAIVVVALHHAITLSLEDAARLGSPTPEGLSGLAVRLLLTIGVLAVPTFLFISGAFAAYAARGAPPSISRRFVVVTLIRLMWPYLLWSLVSYGVVFLWLGERYSVLGYFKNLVVGYPFHFVPLLAFFYLVSPVLVRLSRQHGAAILVGVGFYQLMLIGVVNLGTSGAGGVEAMKVVAPPVLRSTLATWAIFFPLGLVYGLRARALRPKLRRMRWTMAAVTIVLFSLDMSGLIGAPALPVLRTVYCVTFLALVPLIRREAIPLVSLFERMGKRAYGVYLTHLSVLMLLLLLVEQTASRFPAVSLTLILALFIPAVGLPLFLMKAVSRFRTRLVYRYVFG